MGYYITNGSVSHNHEVVPMLLFNIDNDTHAALTPELQSLYEQSDNGFKLKVEGLPDSSSEIERLKQHNEKLIGEKRQRDEAARQAQAERERIEQEALKKNGDFEALEKSYQEKLAQHQSEIERMQGERNRDMVSRQAQNIAQQLADTPQNQQLLQRFINDRLTVVDGQVRVTDKDGKPSASSVDDLATEFKTCGLYDSLLTGTRGSGTGGSGQSKGGRSLGDLTEQERIELARSNPEAFRQKFVKG